MGGLDRAVLVRHAGIVAARGHAVMPAERVVAPGQIGALLGAEIAERCRQAVGAMLAGHATEAPEGILQPFRQGREALAAQHDLGMLPAAARQAKMVEPVQERLAGDGDAELAGIGEVGQAHTARRMILREEHLLIWPVTGPPGAHTPFQGPPDAIRSPLDTEGGLQLLEQGHRT